MVERVPARPAGGSTAGLNGDHMLRDVMPRSAKTTTTPDDPPSPKQWEVRAALRALSRAKDGARRNPAEEMIDAAWKLVRDKDDFTIKDLVERSGVALQTFYRHFGSKDELLLAMLEESMEQSMHGMRRVSLPMRNDPVSRLRWLVQKPTLGPFDPVELRLLAWRGRERQRLSQKFPAAVDAVHEPYRRLLMDAIQAACDAGVARSSDVTLDASLIQHLVLTMTHLVHLGGIDRTPEEVAAQVWQLCWGGLGLVDG